MILRPGIRDFILEGDEQRARRVLDSVRKGRVSLGTFFRGLFDAGAALDYRGPAQSHPLVALQALKNLLGDQREDPPAVLLEYALNQVIRKNFRQGDDGILDTLRRESNPSAVFVMDLLAAAQRGDDTGLEQTAAHLFLAANSPETVLEIVLEVLCLDVEYRGLFAYHYFRSFRFQEPSRYPWTYIRCAWQLLAREGSTPPSAPAPEEPPADFMSRLVGRLPLQRLPLLCAVDRLCRADLVRQAGIGKALNPWIVEQVGTLAEQPPLPARTPPPWLTAYRQSPNRGFVDLAVAWLASPAGTDPAGRLVILEALRALAKTAEPSRLPVISGYLHQLKEDS